MKKLFFAATVILTLSSFGQSDCLSTYRDGYLDLRDVALEFNSGILNRFETASEIGLVSTSVTTKAGICTLAASQSRAEQNCVSDYKSLYNRLRNNINTIKITTGSQKEITFGPVTKPAQNEGVFGRVLRNGLSFSSRQVQRGELAIVDARCL